MSVRLTGSKVVEEVVARTDNGFTKREVKDVIDALAEIAEAELSAGNDFKLPGVATVRLAYQPKKPRREARNPATGETFMANPVPAKIAVRARPDARMKRAAPSPTSKGGKAIAAAYKAKKGL